MTDVLHSFSPDGYLKLISVFSENGFDFVDFFNINPKMRQVILRHDVDFSLEYAVAIGDIERNAGIRSTFFVLLATEFYNILSRSGRALLGELDRQGHEVGLHFDLAAYDGAWDRKEAAALEECAILEGLLHKPVRITAFHRPAQHPFVLGMPGPFAGRVHAYAPEFFTEIAYVSDGAGFWSHGNPLENPAIKAGTAMQLLTHPYLWSGDGQQSALDKIEAFRKSRSDLLITELKRNLRYY